ncbi:hypothetical protein D3C73_1108730 [compost metagenome]
MIRLLCELHGLGEHVHRVISGFHAGSVRCGVGQLRRQLTASAGQLARAVLKLSCAILQLDRSFREAVYASRKLGQPLPQLDGAFVQRRSPGSQLASARAGLIQLLAEGLQPCGQLGAAVA